jgi:hypothetical protein
MWPFGRSDQNGKAEEKDFRELVDSVSTGEVESQEELQQGVRFKVMQRMLANQK